MYLSDDSNDKSMLALADIAQATQYHLVTFRLDRQIYALPIEPIRQIIEMVTITPVPQVHVSVEGVIYYRGTAVPVINLRQHLGMDKIPFKLHTPIILITVAGRLVGLIVDEVIEVLDRSKAEIVRPEDILPTGLGETPLLQGIFQTSSGMVLLLNIEYLFRPQEAQALAEAVTALPDAQEEPPASQPEPKTARRSGKKKKARPAQDEPALAEESPDPTSADNVQEAAA